MTTETSGAGVSGFTGASDLADREAILARALLRHALEKLRAKGDALAEDAVQLRQQRRLARSGEIRGAHDVQHDLIATRLHDLQLLDAGNGGEGALHQRDAGDEGAVAALQVVGHAAGDALHEGQAATAGTGALRPYADVLDPVTDEGHAAVVEVGEDDGALLARGRGAAVLAQEFDVQVLDVEVHALVALALAGDQSDLLAAVAVGDPAAEHLLDERALVSHQHHGGGDDTARPQVRDLLIPEVTRQHVERMGVPEEHLGALAPPGAYELTERALVEVDRVEEHEAVDQETPQALLGRPGERRVAPQRRHLHAVEGPGPLVRAQGIGGTDLEPVAVKIGGERYPGRAAGLVLPELRTRELPRQQLIGGAADEGLGQQRQARKCSLLEVRRVKAALPEEALVVRAVG